MARIVLLTGVGLAMLLILVPAGLIGSIWLPLPAEDGSHVVPGLKQPVAVDFDALGIPRLNASSRIDAFAALGYVTARDRLFQMDLLRRKAAGRLAEIFGADLVTTDQWHRIMGFSSLANAIIARLPEKHRAVLLSYSAGINQAIKDARILPVEFNFLGYRPELWRPEDSILVVLGMQEELSYDDSKERIATTMERALPPEVVEFLTPESDCYNEKLAPRSPIRCNADAVPFKELEGLVEEHRGEHISGLTRGPEMPHGSNGWVVAPRKTRDGRAIMSNDMHLELAVPNIWYRAELNYETVHLAGLTLPGVPMLITGSNGKVAWGFTSVEGDFTDLVRIEKDANDVTKYHTRDGNRSYLTRTESIAVRGGPSVTLQVRETIWGPVLPETLLGGEVALHWTALDANTTNLGIMDMDQAATVHAGLSLFRNAGGPPLNVLLADSSGNIAWTIMGKLPKRFGTSGLFSESWADGKRGWHGYFSPDELPSLINPPSGFLVNTNQNMLSAAQFAPAIGHDFSGGYRAWRVTEQLRLLSQVDEGDMLSLQLDTASEFYRYYQTVALRALNALDGEESSLGALRRYLNAWDGRAEVDSLGLPLLVEFRQMLVDTILSPIVARCREVDPAFAYYWNGLDGPVQRIIESRRPELLPDPDIYRDWPGLIRSLLVKSSQHLVEKYGVDSIERLNWGKVSVVEMKHPLAGSASIVGPFLNMPRLPLAGCIQCVRFSHESAGANSRMIVAPGREADGILEMAGGQSGQPGSSHYADQEASWVAGKPNPFLVQAAQHSMILKPSH